MKVFEPMQTRVLENIHIPLWLCKDTAWMLGWKLIGTSMILPTVGVACWILMRTWHHPMRLPNLAVLCWILANGTWMLGEFFEFAFKFVSLFFFVTGAVVITIFFIIYGTKPVEE